MFGEMFSNVHYTGVQDVVTAHTSLTNVVKNVCSHLQAVRELENLPENGRRQNVGPVHKSVVLMRDIRRKFSNLDYLMLQVLPRTLSTAKACVLLDKHKRLVGCDRNGCCLQKSMASLVYVYSSQLLNDRSDLTGDGKLDDSARLYLPAIRTEYCVNCSIDGVPHLVWHLYSPFRRLWCHTVCTQHREYSTFLLARHLPYSG